MSSNSRLRARHLASQDRELRFELIRLREKSGLKQKDVAQRLGVSPQAISKFERIDADPRLSTIRRYAHAIEALVTHKVEADEGQLADGYEWRVMTYREPLGALQQSGLTVEVPLELVKSFDMALAA